MLFLRPQEKHVRRVTKCVRTCIQSSSIAENGTPRPAWDCCDPVCSEGRHHRVVFHLAVDRLCGHPLGSRGVVGRRGGGEAAFLQPPIHRPMHSLMHCIFFSFHILNILYLHSPSSPTQQQPRTTMRRLSNASAASAQSCTSATRNLPGEAPHPGLPTEQSTAGTAAPGGASRSACCG